MSKRTRGSRNKPVTRQEVRIIGGEWRRRKIPFAQVDGLRPTPDRVRETLFNWLQPGLPGSRVLDLFAGSGCLAFEALSRGAACATLVESSPCAIECLRQARQVLQAESAQICQADALAYLEQPCTEPFDLVFLDPPFALNLHARAVESLVTGSWLAAGALIYLEADRDAVPDWPASWSVHRQLEAGNVVASLLRSL